MTGDRSATVSAVIPTVLRSSLPAAIASARAQSQVVVEVVVVIDRAESDCTPDGLTLAAGADQILFTGGGRRGGHARNVGADAAHAPFVAFLDDDDEWLPDKSRLQLRRLQQLETAGVDAVVSCRVIERHARSGATSPPVPRALIGDDRIEDYLFRRRRPNVERASYFTSSLLMRRQLATAVRWDESLVRHQDWDWLVRVQHDADVQFAHIPEVAVTYAIGSESSISATPDWRGSLDWARRWKNEWSRRTYVDFIAGQPLRYAVQGRSLSGIRRCMGEIARAGAMPSTGPVLLAIASMVPRATLERIAVRRKALAHG